MRERAHGCRLLVVIGSILLLALGANAAAADDTVCIKSSGATVACVDY